MQLPRRPAASHILVDNCNQSLIVSMLCVCHLLLCLQVLCVRHRGGGKLPLPLSALPASLTTLALKKVLLYHQLGSSSSSMAPAQHPQQQQLSLAFDDTEAQEPEHVVGCHALTSPGFRRAVARGLSRPPSPTEDDTNSNIQPAAASSAAGSTSHATAAAGDAASSSCGSGLALLPRLQSLFLKNCLVGGETLQLLLGLQGGSPPTSSSSSNGSAGGARPSQLLRLSVTGDQAAHGEVAEAWPEWVAAVGQLTGLQVRLRGSARSLSYRSHVTHGMSCADIHLVHTLWHV